MEEKNTVEIRIQDLWSVLKKCWIWMVAVALVVGIGFYVYLRVSHVDQYQSTASIYVLRTDDNKTTSTTDVTLANSLINDVTELLTSDHILEEVRKDASSSLKVSQLKKMISTYNPEGTRVLYLTVTSGSKESAMELVNALARNTCTYFNERYQLEILNLVDEGTVNSNISNPISKLKVVLFSFASACAVYLLYLIRYLLDDKINGAEDVERYLGLSLLGDIPNRTDAERRHSKYAYYRSGNSAVSHRQNGGNL